MYRDWHQEQVLASSRGQEELCFWVVGGAHRGNARLVDLGALMERAGFRLEDTRTLLWSLPVTVTKVRFVRSDVGASVEGGE
jgi:hypothetical protein